VPDATRWCPSMVSTSPAGAGPPTSSRAGACRAHMFRINLVQGLGPVLQDRRRLDRGPARRPSTAPWTSAPTPPGRPPGSPTLNGTGPFTDVYSVMNNWGANHGAISFGHIGET